VTVTSRLALPPRKETPVRDGPGLDAVEKREISAPAESLPALITGTN
jgi:hypothetical protein